MGTTQITLCLLEAVSDSSLQVEVGWLVSKAIVLLRVQGPLTCCSAFTASMSENMHAY